MILKDSEGKKDTKAHVNFTISKENKDEENKAEENKAEENKEEENKVGEEFTVNIEKCIGLESSYFSKIDPYIIVTYDGKS